MTETPGKGKSRRTKAASADGAKDRSSAEAAAGPAPDATITPEPSDAAPAATESPMAPAPDSTPIPSPVPKEAGQEAKATEPAAEPTPVAQSPWATAELPPTEPPPTVAPESSDAAEPVETREPKASPPPRRSGIWGWVVAGTLVVLLIALAASFPLWRDQFLPRPADLSGDLAQLRQTNEAQARKIAELEQRVAGLEKSGTQAPGLAAAPPPDLGPLEERLRALESPRDDGEAQRARQIAQQNAQQTQRLEAETQKLAGEMRALSQSTQQLQGSSAQASTVLRLSERLEAAEARLRQVSQRRGNAEALLLAIGQLREAVDSARPFDMEVRAVRTLAAGSKMPAEGIDSIAPFAATGIATRNELAARFERLAPRIVRNSLGPDGDSWWAETVQRLAALISIRRVDGDAAGDSVPASVTRAEAAVKAGRFDRALAELETLQGRPLETVKPWLDAARARVAADSVLAELSAQALTNVATPAPAGGGN